MRTQITTLAIFLYGVKAVMKKDETAVKDDDDLGDSRKYVKNGDGEEAGMRIFSGDIPRSEDLAFGLEGMVSDSANMAVKDI